MMQPGKQPVGVLPSGAWCITCGSDIKAANEPHDLGRDCMPVLDRKAVDATRKRDAAGAVVREIMREEMKSGLGGPACPARDARTGSSDSPALRRRQP